MKETKDWKGELSCPGQRATWRKKI
uniref:Macaca fascicularis brain cDNA clone: QbsB-10245, similar to human interleukin 28 receptor, alpha (interferon, lambdareceptor) (IL28RA), transcript variant 3, mRNA, RefSeq: NM_173065.1 n=1 Tax=Macaca fascicularis TaxID=9541 RepID=I7G4R9_MACFA|nr:unnamed protein product [Macaca fascicularis]